MTSFAYFILGVAIGIFCAGCWLIYALVKSFKG